MGKIYKNLKVLLQTRTAFTSCTVCSLKKLDQSDQIKKTSVLTPWFQRRQEAMSWNNVFDSVTSKYHSKKCMTFIKRRQMCLNLLHNDPKVLSLQIKKMKITTLKVSRQKYINHRFQVWQKQWISESLHEKSLCFDLNLTPKVKPVSMYENFFLLTRLTYIDTNTFVTELPNPLPA